MGIAIFGLNGAGKSTLTHALAKDLNYYEMDVEDYYFPEQKESRKNALENIATNADDFSEELPYSNSRSKEEVQEALEQLGLSATVRGEALTLEQFAALSNILKK